MFSFPFSADGTSAKALGLDENYWSLTNEVGKRNSWWSKKSLESAPDYQRLLKEATYRDASLDSPSAAESETEDNISSLYSCYVQTCAAEFIQCAQGSRTFSVYSECKARHHLCSLQCWVDLTESKFV
ncbi:unnamed protein product [Lymnaea stagnalis]|uniref:Uncharacterized protein n=1 Tax=Lymnaea stagnalis TaxID=6523 RepID=A0AAV2IKD4_LYMST